jgi:hypothetical protein
MRNIQLTLSTCNQVNRAAIYVKMFLYYFLFYRAMVLPGFTAERCLGRTYQTEFGLVYTHTGTSTSIMPSADLCQYYEPGCRRMCRAAGKTGDDFLICMCRCFPSCFCEFP